MVLPLIPPGQIGEWYGSTIASGSAVSLTTATAKDVTSLVLQPGEWWLWGIIVFVGTGTTIVAQNPLQAGISLVTNTQPTTQDLIAGESIVVTTTGFTLGIPVPQQRVIITAQTTFYLDAFATFSAGTMTAYGRLEARRMR